MKTEGVLARLKKEHILPITSMSYTKAYKKTDRDNLTPMLFKTKSFFDYELLPVFFVFSTKDNIEAILRVRKYITELGNDNLSNGSKEGQAKFLQEEAGVQETEEEEMAKFLPPETEDGEKDTSNDPRIMYGPDWGDIEKMREYLSYSANKEMQAIVKEYLEKIKELEANITMSLRQNIHNENENEIKEIEKLYRESIYR